MPSIKNQYKFSYLFTGKYAVKLFLFIIFGFYVVAPILIYITVTENNLYLMTSALASLTIIGIVIGNKIYKPLLIWKLNTYQLIV